MHNDFLYDCVRWVYSDFLPRLIAIGRVLGECWARTIAHNEVHAVPTARFVDEAHDVVIKAQLVCWREFIVLDFYRSLIQVVTFSKSEFPVFIQFTQFGADKLTSYWLHYYLWRLFLDLGKGSIKDFINLLFSFTDHLFVFLSSFFATVYFRSYFLSQQMSNLVQRLLDFV